jgi:16S rRNA (guanine1516-N2)-methyltransferase
MPTINVITHFAPLTLQAKALAEQLHLSFADDVNSADYSLLLTPDSICLQKNGSKSLPLKIDFLAGKTAYRREHTSLKREALARAMGLKNNTTPKIVDATAGLGRDSFILAGLGFDVMMLERSPIIQTLLSDGIQRALNDPIVGSIARHLQLISTDAIHWLKTLPKTERPDIIYLDPMFPSRTKSALAKKDMQIFHDIVGEDPDADKLLPLALTCATKRVVVKRPRLAMHLANLAPSFSQTGSSCRFDIYLTQK